MIRLIKMSLVIQGIADVDGKTTQAEVYKAVDFTFNAVQRNNPEGRGAVLQNVNSTNGNASDPTDAKAKEWVDVREDAHSTDEQRVLKMVNKVFQDYFSVDVFDGMVANLNRGSLGLVKAAPGSQVDKEQPAAEPKFEIQSVIEPELKTQPLIDQISEKQTIVEHKFIADPLQT